VKCVALVLFLVACGSSPKPTSEPSNSTPPEGPTLDDLPAEVKTLTERWENCWHFAGEEGTDPARRKEIEDGLAQWCPGNENERARLRAKYRDRPDVQDALKKLDEMQ
jgi:hypothetical protein